MNKNILISIVALIVIIFLGVVIVNSLNQKNQNSATNKNSSSTSSQSPTQTVTPVEKNSEVKEIIVIGSNYKFDPPEIKVKKGEKVKIIFKNSGGMHDFVIDEFNIRTKVIGSEKEDTIEFTPDKTGTFEYYCSVGNHKQMGMVGNLIVE